MQHCTHYSMLAKCSLAILILLLPGQLIAAECNPVAKLISLEGAVESKGADEEAWYGSTLEQVFCAGDIIRTGDGSRAAVRLTNETLLRLDSNSALAFSHIEKKSRSILDLLRGVIYFISRTPKSLEVRTPYVNASIEGTEFVIQIRGDATDVTVYEGVVIASNANGSISISANQVAHAANHQAPVRTINAKPLDAVTWALYYPSLPEQPEATDTLAQQTITAIAQNRLDEAVVLARQALQENSQSAAAYMAQSYVDQAKFNIPSALSNSQKAAQLAPKNALTQARLAEVWLMTGNTKAAREIAAKAIAYDPKLSLARTVMGFSSLHDVNLDAAKTSFDEAIALDSAAPLPRLGSGLLKIRMGALQSGREDIETAVLLDPNNALLRSYMGKAYYEEYRNSLASNQFAMAKGFDPNDPTAWYYDSILLQSENQPAKALRAQQQAIKLNDNRGVYRSRQLLDQDEAARNTASARIYTDLGFEKMAINEGAKALTQAFENFSAHRFVADINATQPQRSLAVDSELLQSKLLQPLNAHMLRPQLSDLQLADGPARFSYNEFNPLFTQSGPSLLVDGFVAGNNTWGEDIIVSYLHNRFSVSLSQYHYESDGFHDYDWIEKDTLTALTQFNLSPDTMLQIELADDDQQNGDLNQYFYSDIFARPDFSADAERQKVRIGMRHRFTPESLVIGSIFRSDSSYDQNYSNFNTLGEETVENGELQWISKFSDIKTIFGGNITKSDLDIDGNSPYSKDNTTVEKKYSRLYLYTYLPIQQNIELTVGVNYSSFDETVNRIFILPDGTEIPTPKEEQDENQLNPKLGIIWDISPVTTLRFSAFRESRRFNEYPTLEPTQVSGFNQIFNDFSSKAIIDSKRYGLALDNKVTETIYAGTSISYADLESAFQTLNVETFALEHRTADTRRKNAELYAYYVPNDKTSVKFELEYEDYREPREAYPPTILSLKTYSLPIGVKYHQSKSLTYEILATYYNQQGNYRFSVEEPEITGSDNFWLFDGAITYNLPKRLGKLTLGAKNIFDTAFKYEDRLNNSAFLSSNQSTNFYELSSERIIYGKIIFNF